ncbi:MAG: hypothetical protein ACI8X5_001415 [Planctomycetota bacterium]|jgi:hypothetical protein
MFSRSFGIVACALMLAFASNSNAAITSQEPNIELMVAQRAAMRAEREARLLEHFESATPEQQILVEEILSAGNNPQRSQRYSLPLEVISAATAAIQGQSSLEPELAAIHSLTDALGMRVIPGVFAARTEGLGEAMTVSFEPLWETQVIAEPEGGIEIRLYWIAPNGTEELVRTEPATVQALAQGFEVYIRPPLAEAGQWQLVLEVRNAWRFLRNAPIPVECVENLDGLRLKLQRGADRQSSALQSTVARRLVGLTHFGLRSASQMPLAEWIAHLEKTASNASIRPVDCGPLDVRGRVLWELEAGAANRKRAVLLLANPFEIPTDLITGAVGKHWEKFATENSFRVIAAAPALPGVPGFDLYQLAKYLKAEGEVEELIVIARRDFGSGLPSFLKSNPCADFDAVVLSETWGARVKVSERIELPTLRIEFNSSDPGISELSPKGSARRTHVRLSEPQLIVALRTPSLLADWLRSR